MQERYVVLRSNCLSGGRRRTTKQRLRDRQTPRWNDPQIERHKLNIADTHALEQVRATGTGKHTHAHTQHIGLHNIQTHKHAQEHAHA